MSITVVLADDEQMVRSGLRLILESEDDIEVVGRRATAPRPWSSRGAWTRTSC